MTDTPIPDREYESLSAGRQVSRLLTRTAIINPEQSFEKHSLAGK